MKKILISIPYSFNYRNYILTGFINKLAERFLITILLEKNIDEDERFGLNDNIKVIKTDFSRSLVEKILYKIIKERIFVIQNTETFKIKDNLKSFSQKIIRYPFSKSKQILNSLIWIYNFFCKSKKLRMKLNQYDLILFTMCHKPYENKIFINAPKGITKINLVHSWDVITTKGSFFYDYDKTIVWSETNKLEYQELISNIFNFKNEIYVTSPIQFYDYVDKKFEKGEYLLYATSVERLVPNESAIIKKMLQICLKLNIQLKIRNHPQRQIKFFIENNELKEINSDLLLSRDNAKFDFSFFTNVIDDINFAFAVFSVASTICLDALCLNKNVVFLSINTLDFDLNRYYKYDHLKKLINICSIPVIYDENKLEAIILSLSMNRSIPNKMINHYLKLNNDFNNILKYI